MFGSQNERYQLLTEQSGGVSLEGSSGMCCSTFQILTLDLISDQWVRAFEMIRITNPHPDHPKETHPIPGACQYL